MLYTTMYTGSIRYSSVSVIVYVVN